MPRTDLAEAIDQAQAPAVPATRRPSPTEAIERKLTISAVSIQRALPTAFPGGQERFARLVLTAVRMVPDLARCTPDSIVGAAMQSAQLGLEPGVLGQAWIIPRRNNKAGGQWEATFQIGWKGLVSLAARSGFTLTGSAVHRNDEFEYELGMSPKLRHVPVVENRGLAYLWWAIATERETGRVAALAVVDREHVEKRRRVGQSDSPAWTGWYDEMALSKAARECCRLLPLSVEMATAVATDGVVRTEIEGEPYDYSLSDDDAIEVESVEPENGGAET